jgi:trehalose 6-phosphate synthase/phosphatase
VLILSVFAGATAELGDALVVNPYDVSATATTIAQALDMPQEERRDRMRNLRRRVQHYDVHRWAAEFIEALGGCEQAVVASPFSVDVGTVARLAERLKQAPSLTLVLDYDGTLVPLAIAPELAIPDDDLRSLLLALAKRPDTHVHIVSGRPREALEGWFGDLPISLWAEHGFWSREAGETEWVPAANVPPDWDRKISPILDQFTANTPGSLVERKSASVAWHYRIAHEEFGIRQAHELRMLLGDALRNQPLEVLEGRKVVEVRFRGVSKAHAVQSILTRRETGHAILAIGDDRTDEDLFAALPDDAVTVAVGDRSSRARYRLSDYRAVRGLLRTLVGPISST